MNINKDVNTCAKNIKPLNEDTNIFDNYEDFSLDFFDEDDENNFLFGNIQNEISKQPQNDEKILLVPNMQPKNKEVLKMKKISYRQKKNKRKISSLEMLANNLFRNNLANTNNKRFIEYLNIKINGDKNKKITKDTLIIIYNQLQNHLKIEPLKRIERRNKNKIFQKLYDNSYDVLTCIETIPNILNPVWAHLQKKLDKKKEKKERKKALKNEKKHDNLNSI